ncbi:MAG: hypothetical protein AVDCRST_MAG25-3672, partial [uncultured Rubrobacteraceae bacterium]
VVRYVVVGDVRGDLALGRGDVSDRWTAAPGFVSRCASGGDGGNHLRRRGRHARGRGRGLLRCSLRGRRPGAGHPGATGLPRRGKGGVRIQLRPRAGFAGRFGLFGEERRGL